MKNSYVLIATGALALILGGAGCSSTSAPVDIAVTPTPTPTDTNTTTPEAPTPTTPTPTPNPTPKPTPTPAGDSRATYYGVSGVDKVGSVTTGYLATAKVYKESGYYYQFVSCHGNPGLLRMKADVKFMLDNRDKVQHKVVLGNTTYVLPGYGYIIATAPRVYGTQHLVCDGGGAALLSVEK